jgi:hypothetical protein
MAGSWLRRVQLSITMPPLTVLVALPSEITIAPVVWCSDSASECTTSPFVVTLALPLIVTTTPSRETAASVHLDLAGAALQLNVGGDLQVDLQ